MNDDQGALPRISRRRALTILAGASLGAVAAACARSADSPGRSAATSADPAAGSTSTPSVPAAGQADCVLTPEMSEGPFYLDLNMVRRDITEGRPGTPLTLDLAVVDTERCTPVKDAAVHVWHTDAAGDYSGVGGSPRASTFMRGTQVTDAEGKVTFDTVYPGWYQGRAVHIHIKVSTGAGEVHTGQLFFPDDISSAVYESEPYAERGEMDTANRSDGLFNRGGSESMLKVSRNGDTYTGSLTLGVRA